MTEETEWTSIHEREQALLRRCSKYVLGHPDSPGHKPKDILYLTPCRRWLRICSGVVEHPSGDPDWAAVEIASRINSTKAVALFREYNWPRPAELVHPDLEIDLEITREWLGDQRAVPDYTWAIREEPPDTAPELAKSIYREKRKHLMEFQAGIDSTRPPNRPEQSIEEQVAESEVKEYIERNSLLVLLTAWATTWPPESGGNHEGDATAQQESDEKTIASLTDCKKDILRALQSTGDRLSRNRLYKMMADLRFQHGNSTFNLALPQLRSLGLIDNSQEERPKSYGLTEKGKRIAHLLLS